jgi:hypothetical protein
LKVLIFTSIDILITMEVLLSVLSNFITPNYCYEFDTVKIFLSWNKLVRVTEN